MEDVDVDIDALVDHGARHGGDALRTEARRVAQRTRSPAHAATLLGGLASDLAKGVGPFDAAGMTGRHATD